MTDWRRPILKNVSSRAIWLGIASGTVYGITLRLIAESRNLDGVFWVMSLAFIAVAPIVMGYLTVRPLVETSLAYRILAPWIPTLLGSLIALLIGLEGSICIIMGLPLMLAFSSLGGVVAGGRAASGPYETAAILTMPLAFGALESRWPAATQVHLVQTSIEVHAPASRVWNEIVSVREITPQELPPALYLYMGFPRPLSAVIDRPGLGAIRQARFAGGVLFLETVNEWEPEHRLGFRIAVQADQIPPTTLDPHVTIGGPYFDVFQGTYSIDRLDESTVRLNLSSELRVSTHFNWYATLWADRIMHSIQQTILDVEKARAEAPGSVAELPVAR